VFTAPYALSPYVKEIRFVFKGVSVRVGMSALKSLKILILSTEGICWFLVSHNKQLLFPAKNISKLLLVVSVV
jgi:hypothetical protein